MNYLFDMQQGEEERDSRDYYLVYLRVNGCYFWFNVMQIATTLAMLVLLYFEEFFIVTILEIVITFMVALDLILRYFSEGTKNFAANWDNRINFLILSLLVISIGSDLIAPELTHHDGGIMAGLFLTVRYIIQFSRLCRLVIDSKKHLDLVNEQKINLSQVSVEEEHVESTS